MELRTLKCDKCGATLEINPKLDNINCSYCGSKILIEDEATTLKRIEEVKLQARQLNHEQALKEKKELEEAEKVQNFKKSKFSKVLLVFAIICGILTLLGGFKAYSIVALIQAILFLGAWLLGLEIIKQPIKNLYLYLAIAGFVLMIPFFIFFGK